MSKTATLTPEEWKQLCMLGVAQLSNFVQQLDHPTDVHFKLIDDHLDRWKSFMRAWSLSKPLPAPEAQPEQPAQEAQADAAVKRKGGWPKGRKRTPRAQQEAVQ